MFHSKTRSLLHVLASAFSFQFIFAVALLGTQDLLVPAVCMCTQRIFECFEHSQKAPKKNTSLLLVTQGSHPKREIETENPLTGLSTQNQPLGISYNSFRRLDPACGR